MKTVRDTLKALFPIVVADAEMKLVDACPSNDLYGDAALVTFQLIFFKKYPGDDFRQVYDLKEQTVSVVEEEWKDHEKLEDLLLGWACAVEEVLSKADRIERLVPADLMPGASCFALRTPQSAEDYRAAFLVRSRLGRWIEGSKQKEK